MPCSSTIDHSTNALDEVPASFPTLRWAWRWSWKIPLAWLAGMALWLERRAEYRELLELDDRLLDDIGVSRTDIEEVRRSPLYLDAWRHSL
ncbi:DUF1127 domain-containing protein [Afipia sp. GAS231]|uniref:DUF1127 domain-containing protein n=1 Tax=Afipia sp. GAS231 TaxID=1882747 RepID=UPI00087B1033|nr:DUF1127 domain-containing protein [Afipia sp. GAS231]SDN74737.1 protein of unknown function [Afipia sp. GAS231]